MMGVARPARDGIRCGMTLAEKILRALDRAGMKQAQLARASGLSPSAVTAILKGTRRLYADQAFKVAKALGVPLDYLMDDALEDPPQRRAAAELTTEQTTLLQAVETLGLPFREALARLAGPPHYEQPPGAANAQGKGRLVDGLGTPPAGPDRSADPSPRSPIAGRTAAP